MAAPNIAAVTSIIPHTVTLTPADSARNLLVSAPASGSAHKINELVVSNLDSTNGYSATVELRLADGTTYRSIASNITVPANASLIVVDKTTCFYLLDTSVTGEASTIYVTSNVASKLTYSCSYETIS